MKLDILAFAAHPDDTELSCSGTLAAHIAKGYKVGVVDFTRGEMGTRGSAELRDHEALDAARTLGLSVRDNLGFEDVFFAVDKHHLHEVVCKIRQYQPGIVIANAVHDRHPDHGKAAKLVTEAIFLAGLRKYETHDEDGNKQEPWRPDAVYHYIQSLYIKPDIVVDISDYWDRKVEAIQCFKSQFYDPESDEPETFISKPGFMKFLESRAREFGYVIGAEYGEGFTVERYPGVQDLFNLK
ncbi:bacillithiol biosynthesis deacetylase BshB1 [Fulvivirga sedimenti]|uniref:Bacillithiol biosynthesis deacetylase BshB1 n=1 Tax=Fulvivirga sedimenti TaxID=2879465 RepID=A0A9X1HJF7_9BACT|nr:bacillithiol biosynthesis deacetylase BshB1 [Fulvivirga sedimenti]MCA6073228.1 bacillithiol biosynthesis deacetylase BshB1 [Fulvivirga sedimenti]